MRRIAFIALALLICVPAALMASGTADQTPKGPVTVEVWTGASVSEAPAPPADWVAYSLIKEKLNIDLKVVMLPSNFNDQDTKINAAAAANMLPDHFLVNRDAWVRLVQQGLLADVSDMLPMMPERTKQQYMDQVGKKVATVNGKLYALPSPGAIPKVEGVVIRKDWLDKLGLGVPKTLDEFFAVATAFTQKDPDGNGKNDTYGFGGYIDQNGLGPRFDPIIGAFTKPGVWNIDEATFGLTVRDPAFADGLAFMKKIVDAGIIDPDWATLKKDDFRARWKQGKFGIMKEQFAALAAQSNYAPFDTNFPNGQWVAIAPPVGPKGLSAQGTEQPGYRLMAVSKKAADAGKKPAIAKLLEWISTDGYLLFGFGIQGKNFVLDKDGNISVEGIAKDQQYSSPAGQPLTQLRNMVFYNSPVELTARYPYYKTASGRTQGPLQFLGEFKKYPYYDSPGIAIIDPPSNSADFYRYYNENIIKFVLGQTPINADTFKAFNDGLDKLGAKDWEAAAKKKLTANFMLN
jgi:putative aldouronate transport system substrate-binding protein